jgi:hypothetical protein
MVSPCLGLVIQVCESGFDRCIIDSRITHFLTASHQEPRGSRFPGNQR